MYRGDAYGEDFVNNTFSGDAGGQLAFGFVTAEGLTDVGALVQFVGVQARQFLHAGAAQARHRVPLHQRARVVGRQVQRGEVVPVGLDFRARRFAIAELREDRRDALERARHAPLLEAGEQHVRECRPHHYPGDRAEHVSVAR